MTPRRSTSQPCSPLAPRTSGRAYVSTLLHETDVTVSVHVQGYKADPRLGRFALDTVLRRKGRVLDAMSDTMAKARESMSTEDRSRLERLASVRTQLSSSAMTGGDTGSQALMEEARKLEAELSKNADFKLQASPISTETVQKALQQKAPPWSRSSRIVPMTSKQSCPNPMLRPSTWPMS